VWRSCCGRLASATRTRSRAGSRHGRLATIRLSPERNRNRRIGSGRGGVRATLDCGARAPVNACSSPGGRPLWAVKRRCRPARWWRSSGCRRTTCRTGRTAENRSRPPRCAVATFTRSRVTGTSRIGGVPRCAVRAHEAAARRPHCLSLTPVRQYPMMGSLVRPPGCCVCVSLVAVSRGRRRPRSHKARSVDSTTARRARASWRSRQDVHAATGPWSDIAMGVTR
jgi:hypothetical protein